MSLNGATIRETLKQIEKNTNDPESSFSSLGIALRNPLLQAENKAAGLRSYQSGAISGFSDAIPTTETTIAGGLPVNSINRITFPASAMIMAISSTSTDDASGGTGLQTILISGLDEDYNEISEFKLMNGTTKVTTTASFLRINRLIGLSSGSGGFNVGNIYIGADSDTFTGGAPDTNIFHSMGIDTNISSCHIFTVPLNRALYFIRFNVNTDATESKPIRMNIYLTGFESITRKIAQNIFSASSEFETPTFLLQAEKSDIEFTGENQGAGTVIFQVFSIFALEDLS